MLPGALRVERQDLLWRARPDECYATCEARVFARDRECFLGSGNDIALVDDDGRRFR